MSDFAHFKGRKPFVRDYTSSVNRVIFSPGGRSRIMLADGKIGDGTCLGCADTPCIQKDKSENEAGDVFKEFPGNTSLDVCPTMAIQRDEKIDFLYVKSDQCIGCGLCVLRCPYGAINLQSDGIADIATVDNEGLTRNMTDYRPHPTPEIEGSIATTIMTFEHDNMKLLTDFQQNLLVRNLMQEIGVKCNIRRPGDQNFRSDMFGSTERGRPFIAEVEFFNAEIESPRRLLEGLAVMHARYNLPVHSIDALSIVSKLPNKRSEYYQVMTDIERVLGIKCRTITIGALLAILWSRKKISEFKGDAFSVNADNKSLVASLKELGVDSKEPYLGAFTPEK